MNPLVQQNPQVSSGLPHYRSFSSSLATYERAARKEYILLMRNFAYTEQYPDFHVVIGFHKLMPIQDFSKIRNKAFGKLVKEGVKAYYVHEPSEAWIHIHAIAMYDGKISDLRKNIKESFTSAGLKYREDFHVKVKPINPTFTDYKRLCSYILKFNGKRISNRRVPDLFEKGSKLRKMGTIGKWFVKGKKVLWQEYRKELEQKHEQRD